MPKLLGIAYARLAVPVKAGWESTAQSSKPAKALALAKLKSLSTFEARVRSNPLTAGDPVARDRWPKCATPDYGRDLPNLFRFELADRWRGYYSLVGEPGGVRVWVLYLWDHETYSRQSGYEKK
jgi:hypothetical protein